MVLTIGGDRAVRMWNAKDGTSLETALVHGDVIGIAEFSRDGSSILTYSADGTARIWSRKDRLGVTQIADVPRAHHSASVRTSNGFLFGVKRARAMYFTRTHASTTPPLNLDMTRVLPLPRLVPTHGGSGRGRQWELAGLGS